MARLDPSGPVGTAGRGLVGKLKRTERLHELFMESPINCRNNAQPLVRTDFRPLPPVEAFGYRVHGKPKATHWTTPLADMSRPDQPLSRCSVPLRWNLFHVPMVPVKGRRFVHAAACFFSRPLAHASGYFAQASGYFTRAGSDWGAKWRCVRGRFSAERVRRDALCQVRMPITGLVRVAGHHTCGF